MLPLHSCWPRHSWHFSKESGFLQNKHEYLEIGIGAWCAQFYWYPQAEKWILTETSQLTQLKSTENESQAFKNAKCQTINLLEKCRTFSGLRTRSWSSDLIPKAQFIEGKNGLNQNEQLLPCDRSWQEDEKTSYRVGGNICKSHFW